MPAPQAGPDSPQRRNPSVRWIGCNVQRDYLFCVHLDAEGGRSSRIILTVDQPTTTSACATRAGLARTPEMKQGRPRISQSTHSLGQAIEPSVETCDTRRSILACEDDGRTIREAEAP